jgi:hypothetical protein
VARPQSAFNLAFDNAPVQGDRLARKLVERKEGMFRTRASIDGTKSNGENRFISQGIPHEQIREQESVGGPWYRACRSWTRVRGRNESGVSSSFYCNLFDFLPQGAIIDRLRRGSLIGALAALVLGGQAGDVEAADPPNGLTGIFGESAGSARVVPSSGAMAYTVAFELPRARGNSQPSLALQYASGAGTGEGGMGWSLNLPQIERAPLSGWPKYIDNGVARDEDRYTYSGQPLTFICVVGGSPACPANEQVGPMPSWANGYRHYRLLVEGTFERFFLSADRQTWIVQRRGGELLEFGAPLTRADLTGPGHDIDIGAGVFRWNIVRQHDLHGIRNLVVYGWIGLSSERQYLSDIYYTPPAVGGDSAGVDAFAYHVELSWEFPQFRVADYTLMDKRRISRRLSRVAVTSKPWSNGGARELVRAYKLTYFGERTVPGNPGEAPLWGRSSLQQVQMEGACGVPEIGGRVPDPTGCPPLPPVTFGYQPAELAFGEATRSAVAGNPAVGNDGLPYVVSTAVMDVDRDGRLDIVQAWPQNLKYGMISTTYADCPAKDATFIVRQPEGVLNWTCRAGNPDRPACCNALSCGPLPDPQLTCSATGMNIRSAREQIAYLNKGVDTSGRISLLHACLDAGSGFAGTITGYHIGNSLLARNGALFTQFSGEAIGEWGDASSFGASLAIRAFVSHQRLRMSHSVQTFVDVLHPILLCSGRRRATISGQSIRLMISQKIIRRSLTSTVMDTPTYSQIRLNASVARGPQDASSSRPRNSTVWPTTPILSAPLSGSLARPLISITKGC